MKWFNNQKVAVKVFLSCFVFIILISIISVQGIISMNNSNDSFQTFYKDRFEPVVQLNEIFGGILQVRINMLQEKIAIQLNNEEAFRKRLASSKKIHEIISNQWGKYISTYLTEEEKKLADDFKQHYDDMKKIAVEFVNALKKNDIKGSGKISNRWLAEYHESKKVMDKLIHLQDRIGKELQTQQEKNASNVQIISIILLSVSIFMGIIITILLARSVSTPVNKGLKFAEKLAEGDLTQRIDLNQKDELGMLGAALNKAADNIENLLANVSVAAQNLTQAVQQIASGNENLSQRTSEMASSLEEIASSIEEAVSSVNQNADNSMEGNKVSKHTSGLAEEGGIVLTRAIEAINEINESSKKMGEIVSVINEISFQTNLLALNAAVEAARAGEHGRGFAVVASEVRNLAQRSGASSKEIEQLINESVEKIKTGTELSGKSGEALQEIITSVKKVNEVIDEITAASNEQKQGMSQINTAITDMDSVTQENASLVEETASASEEMSNQAEELLHMVEKFRIREQGNNTKRSEPYKKIHLNETKKNDGKIKPVSAPVHVPEKDTSDLSAKMKEDGFDTF